MTRTSILLLAAILAFAGCGPRETRVEIGNKNQILHLANGTEVEDIDPQIVTGVPEHNVISSLIEGLVSEDPIDLHPVPGVAERWDISDDGTVYTFHFRSNAVWSTGEPVTAQDFVQSYQRILTPTLASEYAYMLYPMRNAEAYQTGQITDFDQVGVKALDARTLQITLNNPTPYFLSLLNHYTWFPVHIPTIRKFGELDARGNPWTKPGNFIGNGPFVLKDWRISDVLIVEKNTNYWDADKVRLQEIHFYAMDSAEAQEQNFRNGQLHNTYTLTPSKIEAYRKSDPDLLRIDPYLASYFYRINVTVKPTDDKRVRQALTMAIDRESLVKNVTRASQLPAHYFTPPGTAGYTARARFEENVEKARQLLAEAGYPKGENFPRLEILFNTDETHRAVAEAIQEMWRKNLNINAELVNQEWKVYLDAQRRLDYQVSRAGWTGDYVDPNTFLDLFTSWSQQNQTGWKNEEYDKLIADAATERDPAARLELFQKAEAILLDELPIIPLYIYTRPYLLRKSVQGWHPTILDHHPYKYVYLNPNAE